MISVFNSISSKFGIFPQAFWKVVRHTCLKAYRERERERERESSGDSWFVTNNLLVYYTISDQKQDLFHSPIRFSL